MPIEFSCPFCTSVLRVPDETAGRKAKCPQCSAVVPIPGIPVGSDPAMGQSPPPDGGAGPGLFGPQETMGPGGPFAPRSPEVGVDPSNPYQSPAAVPTFTPSPLGTQYYRPMDRSGPPWEREGPSVETFLKTIQQQFGQLSDFYSTMRCEGGFWLPLAFLWISSGLANVVYSGYQVAFRIMLGSAVGMGGGGGGGPFGPGNMDFGIAGDILGAVIGIAIVPVQIFIGAAITHVCLILVGGAKRGYETTFRVMCYAGGSAAPLVLIPCVGIFALAIASLVFEIVGLSKAHDISVGKAVLAVFLPLIVCFGLALVLGAVAILIYAVGTQ